MKNVLFLIILLLPCLSRAQSVTIVASDTTVCVGTSVTFTASVSSIPFADYWWKVNGSHVGPNNATFTTSSLASGDTVRCNITSGAILMATSGNIVMTVDTVPNAGVITGADTVCLGATVTLSNSMPGGIWESEKGYVTVNNGIAKGVDIASAFECYREPGDDTVLYVVSNACGSDTAYKALLVHPLANPYFFVYDNSVCVGQSILLNAATPICAPLYSTYGYVSHDYWLNDWLRGVKPGKDYVYSIAENYCGTLTYGQWITVIGKPGPPTIISSAQVLCVGEYITVYDSSSYASRGWNVNNSNTQLFSSSYSKDATLRGVYEGTSTITLTHGDRCGSSTTSIVVTVNPNPPHSAIRKSSCEDMSLLLTNSAFGGTWSTANKYVATIDQSGKLSAVTPGEVLVIYTLPTGCSTADEFTISDCSEIISIFPLPAKEEITIRTLAAFNECVITNSLGQIILRQKITGEYTAINTGELAPGVYFATLTGNGRYTGKFVKQ